jgi:hypothetical protein
MSKCKAWQGTFSGLSEFVTCKPQQSRIERFRKESFWFKHCDGSKCCCKSPESWT